MSDERPRGLDEFGITRRSMLTTAAAAGLGGPVLSGIARGDETSKRPRIAMIGTINYFKSHVQGILDRFLDGYGFEGHHYRPRVDVVSLYVDQKPKGDLTAERLARHPALKEFPSVAGALTMGGKDLAVDGVLLIGEHGDYPRNAQGQTLYPRYQLFREIVDVFRKTGKSVPVFNDKHLSWRWDWAKEMVDTAHAMGFPFMAGSSLPVTWRIPSVDVPFGAEVQDAVAVGYGGVDSYDFHGLETLQCMVERRKGGETGVVALQALRGPAVWKALAGEPGLPGPIARDLFETCLCRSFTLASPRPGYGNAFPSLADMPRLCRDPLLYRIEYADGLKGTLLMLNRLVQDFTVAVRLKGEPSILSTQMNLPGLTEGQTLPNFFSALSHQVEAMFLTGKASYPVERTLLTTGLVAAAVESLAKGQVRLETPHLAKLSYTPPRESTFLRS